jgi:IS30 family transposase
MSVRKCTWTTRKGETREAWIVDYIDQNCKRHIETLRRKKEAEARKAKVRIDIGKGVHLARHDEAATLVERNIRFTMLVKIPGKDTTTVVTALAKYIRKLPEELRRFLTWDQGKEMHAHKRFTVATNVQVYFCDPRSPWQRDSNESTKGLLRQYFPRGTNFSRISQSDLNAIALRLNQRPRKTLGFETPADRLLAVLH